MPTGYTNVEMQHLDKEYRVYLDVSGIFGLNKMSLEYKARMAPREPRQYMLAVRMTIHRVRQLESAVFVAWGLTH